MTTDGSDESAFESPSAANDWTHEDDTGHDLLFAALMTLFVGQNDDSKNRLPMTVAIGGLLISGTVVSAKIWKESLVAAIEPAQPDLAESMGAIMSAIADAQATDDPVPTFRHIHMLDVRVVSGDSSYWLPAWRGNLDKLTGWAFGPHKAS